MGAARDRRLRHPGDGVEAVVVTAADSSLLRVTRGSAAAVIAGAVAALVGGLLIALGIWTLSPSEEHARDEACVDPPCPPESLPEDLASLPFVLPVFLQVLALGLGCVVLLLSVAGRLRGRRSWTALGLWLVVSPVAVLALALAVPHVVTPCWFDVRGVCVETVEHGRDYADDFHLLGHAVFGWAPAAAAVVVLLRRRHPEALPHRGPGRARPGGG